MYKEILKEQLEKLQNWQRKTAFTSDELIRFSTMIQETARKLQNGCLSELRAVWFQSNL